MTRVDFYILSQSGPEARTKFACRLAEKAWQQGHSVYIHTGDEGEAARLDDLLWSFSQGSFVPHEQLAGGSAQSGRIVYIGHQEPDHELHDVLINLDREVPTFFSRFERLAEVIEQDDESRKSGRERYRFYRERGYPLQSHEL